MADVLLRMLVLVTAGLIVVLLVRRVARRMFGAGPAFTLWLLPLALMLAPLVPHGLGQAATWSMPALLVTPGVAVAAHSAALVDWKRWVLALWLFGAGIGLLRLAAQYLHLRRVERPMPPEWSQRLADAAPDLDTRRVRVHAAGPAVLWAWPRALILLPEDFFDRFNDPSARELVLRHELTHAWRGDAWWTLAMEIASVLLWFHPLAWFSRPRFRLDQELACDAASLRGRSSCAASYARTLLDSIAVQPAPALIPWLAEPQLKERLDMITRIPPGTLRRRAGFVSITALLSGCLLVAGGQPAAAMQAAASQSSASKPPSVDVAYKNDNPPRYPVDALRNGEQGTVILRIHVSSRGIVTKVDVDKAKTTTNSAELQAAAVTAAENWKFRPGSKDSQLVGGWMTIPVRFALQPAASS